MESLIAIKQALALALARALDMAKALAKALMKLMVKALAKGGDLSFSAGWLKRHSRDMEWFHAEAT